MKGTRRQTRADSERRARAEISAYEFTIGAIVCIGRAFQDLASASVRQGPRMKGAQGGTVTPDMTIEVAAGPHAGYRAINEIKPSLPARLAPLVGQLRRYDDNLDGWEDRAAGGGGPVLHDIIVTIPAKHATSAARLESALKDRGAALARPFSILSFEHREGGGGGGVFYAKKISGRISHKGANDGLEEGLGIDSHALLGELNTTKFYDAPPPLPYLMSILWNFVFMRLVHDKKRRSVHAGQAVTIAVETGRLHRLASRFAPASNHGCLRRAQVKNAMDRFVRLGIARNGGGDTYEIRYRKVPGALDWLVGLVAADDASEAGGGGEEEPVQDAPSTAGGSPC